MSPERARIFIAEDSEITRKYTKMGLIANGHSVEIEAGSLEEAMEKIEEAKQKKINVALIDGSLSYDPSDGLKISQALRAEIPDIKIISISDRETDWSDESCEKPFTFEELLEKVKKI